MRHTVLIRTDVSHHIGTGHVMRCLALAQAAQDAGQPVTFVLALTLPSSEQRLQQENMHLIHVPHEPGSTNDALATISIAKGLNARWVVVDGYHFGTDYLKQIKEAGLLLLVVDDNGQLANYEADILLNQNLHARETLYRQRAFSTRLLLGPHYALLRRDFKQWREWKRENPRAATKILVTLGGTDPNNVTLKIIEALQKAQATIEFETVVVIGGGNQHVEQLQSATAQSRHPIRLERNVTDMPSLMAWADTIISAGGSTLLETAFMGLPALVIELADNQRQAAQQLDEFGSIINLGWHDTISPTEIAEALKNLATSFDKRSWMSQQGRSLIDGRGAERVILYMGAKSIHMRPVNQNDCRQIWEWANDLSVREMSFLPEPIPWESHVKWFESRINNPNIVFLLAENDDGRPVGQVRFDITGAEARVSISLDQQFRGKGYGAEMLRKSAALFFQQSKIDRIQAYIKPENKASQRAFLKAGYQLEKMTLAHNIEAGLYVLRRE